MATALGWPEETLTTAPGWRTSGRVNGVEVDAMTAPLSFIDRPVLRHSDASTAAHAALLRTLANWSAALPLGVRTLEVAEDDQNEKGFTVHMALDEHVLPRVSGRPRCPHRTACLHPEWVPRQRRDPHRT